MVFICSHKDFFALQMLMLMASELQIRMNGMGLEGYAQAVEWLTK